MAGQAVTELVPVYTAHHWIDGVEVWSYEMRPRERWTVVGDSFRLPDDPFDIADWMDWEHVPSCPCDDCEDFRKNNGLSCMFGLGPRPEGRREHNWAGQWLLAGGKIGKEGDELPPSP